MCKDDIGCSLRRYDCSTSSVLQKPVCSARRSMPRYFVCHDKKNNWSCLGLSTSAQIGPIRSVSSNPFAPTFIPFGRWWHSRPVPSSNPLYETTARFSMANERRSPKTAYLAVARRSICCATPQSTVARPTIQLRVERACGAASVDTWVSCDRTPRSIRRRLFATPWRPPCGRRGGAIVTFLCRRRRAMRTDGSQFSKTRDSSSEEGLCDTVLNSCSTSVSSRWMWLHGCCAFQRTPTFISRWTSRVRSTGSFDE